MKALIFIFCVLVFARCSLKRVDEVSADEYAIINLVLAKAVPSDSIYKNQILYYVSPEFTPRFPPRGYKITAKERLIQVNNYDSLRRIMDTAKICIFISDSLFKFPTRYFKNKSRVSVKALRASQIQRPDLVRKILLSIDTGTKATRIDTGQINRLYTYQSIFYNKKSQRQRNAWSPGEVVLSRAAFSKDRDMACVYAQTYRNEKYAAGALYFLQKANGTWVLIDKQPLWIA